MRVLIISLWFYPERSGSPRQSWVLAQGLAQRGVAVSAVTAQRPGLAARETVAGIPIHRIWARGGAGFARAGSRASYADAFAFMLALFVFLCAHAREFDILHVQQGLFPAVSAVLAALCFRKRCVITFSGTGISGNIAQLTRRWFNRLTVPILRRAAAFIVLTAEGQTEIVGAGFDPARTHIIPNGIDLAAFPMPTQPVAAPIIAHVARMTYEKDHATLVRALARMAHRDAHVQFAGDGPERARIEQLARELGVHTRAHLLGETDRVAQVLANARVFVLPSLGEGMSLALLEAMATGLPCVVSDIPANRALIQDDANGLIFHTGDADDLARCLDRVLSDTALARRLGVAARQTVAAQYTVDRFIERHLALYRALTSGAAQ